MTLPYPLRILLIDDSPTQRNFFAEVVRSCFHEATEVDATDSLFGHNYENYHCILLDLTLGDISPRETLASEIAQQTATPVVVFTASYSAPLLNMCAEAGIQNLTIKSFGDNIAEQLGCVIHLAIVNHRPTILESIRQLREARKELSE